jgi:hypothetical protein
VRGFPAREHVAVSVGRLRIIRVTLSGSERSQFRLARAILRTVQVFRDLSIRARVFEGHGRRACLCVAGASFERVRNEIERIALRARGDRIRRRKVEIAVVQNQIVRRNVRTRVREKAVAIQCKRRRSARA